MNNNIFNINRFRNLIYLQAYNDFRSQRSSIMSLVAVFTILIIVYNINGIENLPSLVTVANIAVLIVSARYTINFMNSITKANTAINYIMIPASKLEKLLVAMLFTTILLGIAIILAVIIAKIIALIISFIIFTIPIFRSFIFNNSPIEDIMFNPVSFIQLFFVNYRFTEILYLLIFQSVLLYAGSILKKNSLGRLFLIFLGYMCVSITIMFLTICIILSIRNNINFINDFGINYFVSIKNYGVNIISVITPIFFYYLLYLRIGEAEVS